MKKSPLVPDASSSEVLTRIRAEFRARVERESAPQVWKSFPGRIAIALCGGGTRGAYQAGALLAFQDAQLPSHIIAATSVGSINAAGYAGNSDGLVGNAEAVVGHWLEVTPTLVGIEWTRYAWMLGGLIAFWAGVGNLLYVILSENGYAAALALHRPRLTWTLLGLAGLAVLLLYDQLPYVTFVARSLMTGRVKKIQRRKAVLSVLANSVVIGFMVAVLLELNFAGHFLTLLRLYPAGAAGLVILVVLLLALRKSWSAPLSGLMHKLLRLPLRPGLFPNYERARFIRERLDEQKLRASPIHVVFSATDLQSGDPVFFSNTPAERLATEPGADAEFIRSVVVETSDLVGAVVASSALPLAYEPMLLHGRMYADGGLCANQPLRPAIRLGADVVFLVMMDSLQAPRKRLKTFVDVGLSAVDILMRQTLVNDLRIASHFNITCERAAQKAGLHPEEIEIVLGPRRYRYVRAFPICPQESLPGSALDFDEERTRQAILLGYQDGMTQILEFLVYARSSRFSSPRHELAWELH
ncbi:MAG TPA: patatin-like phospholipase family protein [Candidatus Binatia bacterium]|nr:patatin-like phospholipase family protein [Candidatus Binatia bacterium]